MAESSVASHEPTWDECVQLLDELPSLPIEARIRAVERLVRNPSPGIRQCALRVGAAALPDERVIEYLREEADDVIRNLGLELMKLRGRRGFAMAATLLHDANSDVVLQAVLILDHLRDPRAVEPLRAILRHPDLNVVQAVIVALGHLGDSRVTPEILAFLDGDPWLQLAAVEALGNLHAPSAIVPLKKLLPDLLLGPVSSEALAKIGGTRAFRALAEHWVAFHEELDTKAMLDYLAHVLEGLVKFPSEIPGLRSSLEPYLASESREIQEAAAQALLALGPGAEDSAALHVLFASRDTYQAGDQRRMPRGGLPSCLRRRKDLLSVLLHDAGPLREWGFMLAAQYPHTVSLELFLAAMTHDEIPESMRDIAYVLSKMKNAKVAPALLRLFVRASMSARAELIPAIRRHRMEVQAALERDPSAAPETQVLLAALLSESADTVVSLLSSLSEAGRIATIPLLTDRKDVLRQLPWSSWLALAPDLYSSLIADVVVRANLRELVPLLCHILEISPNPDLIRTVGAMGDRASIPILLRHLDSDVPLVRATVLDCLGRLGGPEARSALRKAAESGDAETARIAYRGLSLCATEEDDAFFRDSATSPDWYVRLSCAEVLARFRRPENLAALMQLTADPAPIVAEKALGFVENKAERM